MKQVICYTIYGCPKCQRVLKHLEQKGVNVKEINIMEQPDRAYDVIKLTGEVIAPVLLYNAHFVVGDNLEEVEDLIRLED